MNLSKVVMIALLSGSSVAAYAGTDGYVGAGLGVPSVAYGSSSLAAKIFGGYKIHEFELGNAGSAGKLDLAIQGEYVDFGNSSVGSTTWTQTGVAVAAVGSWVIPRKWAEWADEKFAVVAKLGGSQVSYSSNWGASYTDTGLTEGVGAEYNFTQAFTARAMVEYYPGSYNIYGISGMFRF